MAWTNAHVVSWLTVLLQLDPVKHASRVQALTTSGLHGALLFWNPCVTLWLHSVHTIARTCVHPTHLFTVLSATPSRFYPLPHPHVVTAGCALSADVCSGVCM